MGVKKGTILPRGICPVCGQDRPLNKEGVLMGHGGCLGEHERPIVPIAVEQGGRDG